MSDYSTPSIKELSIAERPQERLVKYGAGALSDIELLAMLIRSGSKGHNALSVASQLINKAGSLAGLVTWGDQEFRKVKGIGPIKALQLVTVVEICRRVLAARGGEQPICDSPDVVYRLMQSHALGLEVEKFWTLSLNRKNRIIRISETTSGTASNSLVHPREVFRESIRNGASAVICVHNHPSGDPAPSAADIKVTRQLREASKVLSIDLLDHLIVGDGQRDPRGQGYYSFQESGLL